MNLAPKPVCLVLAVIAAIGSVGTLQAADGSHSMIAGCRLARDHLQEKKGAPITDDEGRCYGYLKGFRDALSLENTRKFACVPPEAQLGPAGQGLREVGG